MIRLREIIRRMEQGFAEAVLCRADGGTRYVVKSRLSGRESLVREWLCFRIGTCLGLPIPPASLVYMDAAAVQYSVFAEAAALADCPGFGSSLIEPADLLMPAGVIEVPAESRASVLLFDWWVRNGDRHDANSNLLWIERDRSLHVIDHNLAFGRDTDEDFWQYHLFRRDRSALAPLRAAKAGVMAAIIDDLPRMWAELPEEWTDACLIRLADVDVVLRRCLADSFWEVP